MTHFSKFLFCSLFFVSFVVRAQFSYKPVAHTPVVKPIVQFTKGVVDATARSLAPETHLLRKGHELGILDGFSAASSSKICSSKPGFLLNLVRRYPLTTLWFGLTVIGALVHWNSYTKQCYQAEQQFPLPEDRSDDDLAKLDKTKKDLFFDCMKNTAFISAACAAFCYMLKK